MDPISLAFATYIDLVSSRVYETMTDLVGTEIQSVVVKHDGMDVSYFYQMWKIRSDYVCTIHRHDIQKFSRCSITAKSLFQKTCIHLQNNPQSDWKYRKLKNMYCHAANTYQPVLASIQKSEARTPLQQARTECDTAIAKLMNHKSDENRKSQELACEKYRQFQRK